MSKINLTSPPRERTSVAIQGLDISTPDDIVADGKCATLHNLRYNAGAWRPVHPHKVKYIVDEETSHELEIVYHHPAAGENTYIATYKDEPETFASISFTQEGEPEITPFATVRNVANISHFGNVLIFETTNTVAYFLLTNGEYKKITFPPYARIRVTNIGASHPYPTSFCAQYYDEYGQVNKVEEYPYSDEKMTEVIRNGGEIFEYITAIADLKTGLSLLPIDGEHAWRGEILLFSTWQLEDGTNISPSPLLLIHSSLEADIPHEEFYAVGVDDDKILKLHNNKSHSSLPFSPSTETLSEILPEIEIRITKNWDYSSIKKLVIWSTRIHPTFVSSIPTDPMEKQKMLERFWFADNDLANQPFYKLTEISVGQFVDDPEFDDTVIPDDPTQDPDDGGVDEGWDPGDGWDPGYDDWDPGYDDDWGGYALPASTRSATTGGDRIFNIMLSRSTLEPILTKEVYVPNNNTHLLFASNPFDYNNRFHYFNYKQVLAKGYHISDSNNPYDVGAVQSFHEWVELDVDDKQYNIVSSSSKNGLSLFPGTPMYDIISYPDMRAKRYSVEQHFRVPLTPAPANNFAWYKQAPTRFAKFPPISLDYWILTGDELPNDNSVIVFNNKIQVTTSNNLFSIPFENNYSVGSRRNKILALQSGAIETHEMKVGELPLYVFTEEGIFALIAGQNTLYSSVVAINYDKIINPNTLAINGAIVYITEKGVHLLTSQGSQIISSPIHSEDGMPDLEFLKSCKILYPKQYNEFALYNDSGLYPSAFIFNIDTGYWSTRTLTGRKLNTDELYHDTKIYDLGDEDETKYLPVAIETRPIKLGNVELKRLETIIPRFQVGNSHPLASMSIDGSIDGSTYIRLRAIQPMEFYSRLNPFVIRRTPFSAKYFKLYLDFTPIEGEDYAPSITNIDFEWYRKFYHRMR